jgi:hypothetical protein
MLIVINIICFLLALFTPLGLAGAIAGLVLGVLKVRSSVLVHGLKIASFGCNRRGRAYNLNVAKFRQRQERGACEGCRTLRVNNKQEFKRTLQTHVVF